MKLRKRLTVDDISTWNQAAAYSKNYNFSVSRVSEKVLSNDAASGLEFFVEEQGHFADMFNTEYMGHLTGQVDCSKEDLIDALNSYFHLISK